MSLNEKARETIAKYGMINASDAIFVGLSGGADSVCLLHFLCGVKDEFSLDVTAMHLNHKLRGDESDRDEAFVKMLCGQLNVRLIAESADVGGLARERGISLEEAGREARYTFFSRCCSEKNVQGEAVKIAVAHSLNDSVETMLLNFARGTALRGLSGIPPVRKEGCFYIIRPLIACSREEIEEYCEKNRLKYVTDSTNLSDSFARNKLRHYVLPELAGINQGFLNNAAATLDSLREDADFLDRIAEESLAEIKLSENLLDRKKYLVLPHPIRLRVLISELSRLKIPIDSARLSRLDAIAGVGNGAEQLSSGICYAADRDCIEFRPPKLAAQDSGDDFLGGETDIPKLYETIAIDVFLDKKLRLMNTDYEHYEESIKYSAKLLKNALDCDKIDGTLKLRQKSSTMRIKLNGAAHARTLKNLFQEAKISPDERGRTVILSDDEGLIWVEGFGAAERVAVTDAAERVLILSVEKEV